MSAGTMEFQKVFAVSLHHTPSNVLVAGVVVTYNRLKLLQRLITSLRKQTRKLDKIFIINNGSTDGTAEWVQAQDDLTLITQDNVGSAGGQATGIRLAFDEGYDWVWCMDDDGCPEIDALEQLMPYVTNDAAEWLNCLVVDTENPARLAFTMYMLDTNVSINTAQEARNLGDLIPSASPFNGTLLSKQLINAVGCPHPELFIWGDETEYYSRVYQEKLRIRTVTNSIYSHPASANTHRCLLTIRGFYKHYYAIRNANARVTKDGKLILSGPMARKRGFEVIKHLLIDSVTIPLKNLVKVGIVLHAMWAATWNDRKRRYM